MSRQQQAACVDATFNALFVVTAEEDSPHPMDAGQSQSGVAGHHAAR
jgi:hypothetical protein